MNVFIICCMWIPTQAPPEFTITNKTLTTGELYDGNSQRRGGRIGRLQQLRLTDDRGKAGAGPESRAGEGNGTGPGAEAEVGIGLRDGAGWAAWAGGRPRLGGRARSTGPSRSTWAGLRWSTETCSDLTPMSTTKV